ncbi:MAG: transcription-repair coupling factor [Clostridiales bacterium]|jgi:transcription-repair coupling factor (superfamily II helicase)|nr:transcription-repair coupling factor [Clostridiales bacterium]
MNNLFSILNGIDSFADLVRAVNAQKTPALATGVIDSQKCHVCSGLMAALGRSALVITHSELKAREIYEDLCFFLHDSVKFYPSKDIIFYSADIKSADIIRQRFSVIKSLLDDEKICVVLSVEALFDRLAPPEMFKENILTLTPGDIIETNELAERLVRMGYERVDLVEAPGHFAVRGGIIDLFTAVYNNALRIDFFGDEIDSIKLLDTYSQRSVEELCKAVIYPMRELVYDTSLLKSAVQKIISEFNRAYMRQIKTNPEAAENLKYSIQAVIDKLNGDSAVTGIDGFSQYFYTDAASLFHYFPYRPLVFFDEPNRISEHAERVLAEFSDSIQNRILAGRLLPSQTDMVFSYAQILNHAESFDCVLFTSLTQAIKGFTVRSISSFTVKSQSVFQYAYLRDELQVWRDAGYQVLMLAGGKFQAQKLAEEITDMGFSAQYFETQDNLRLNAGVITVIKGALKSGFEYPLNKLAVISIMARVEEKRKKRLTKQKASKIQSFTDLRVGDYVVHDNHGIGVYEGIEQITVDNVSRDYLKLSYSDGGKLYVQTNQMEMIQKYIGGEGVRARLNKLGGSEWGKAKNKARKAVAALARDLVALYAKRQGAKGFAYAEDTVWQREFEDTFPFQETEDQLLAIEDVKRDMEQGKVMDRLICGDVGYGKTEVAIRAAFKTIQDNRQVAYLAPTTILAQQHFNTFRQRMDAFPINIEMLSRFRTAKDMKETLSRLKSGTCDIVIGTHRLLSSDVRFKNLGLIIVDEEQRFGVTHKERLKKLRENVNVLTLTATPIPRTLHLSLTGIRDMSILEEPPHERQPIQTYVMEYNPEFVRDAINRELARGGQVYYLHNRVQNIEEEAMRVSNLLPRANVAYAHGQMAKHELENIMLDFIEGAINVLVCTTIIETGLDIPNVNTIIIQNADYMGLSQLYQLRGRVGRSNRLAYAYLMYRRDKVLAEAAEKRLQTIREFTEFGSGFKIAMRDLEIRGAGNLLGAEQHGHMDSVGYDMYCKLLSQAVLELTGGSADKEFETFIDIPINAFIPSSYIANEEQKLEIYKKISLISSQRDFYDVQEEIEERYGQMPASTANLLSVALLKAAAHEAGVISIIKKNKNILITFKPDAPIDSARVARIISDNRLKLLLTQAPNPYITYRLDSNDLTGCLEKMRGWIDEMTVKQRRMNDPNKK